MKFLFEGESVIESIIQRHLSYQFCFCINTVVAITAMSVGPCHHGMARPQVADRGTASDKESSCE